MRIISTILALLALSTCLFAQEDTVDISLPLKTGQKVILNLRFAEKIEVKTWNKKELSIRAYVQINGGLLNEAHKIDTVMGDKELEISTGFDEDIIKNSGFRDCDGKNRSQYNFDGRRGNRNYNICHTINYTIFLPAETDLEIETISGDIAIANMKSELEAKSVSGVVDVIIAKNQKADVLLESVSGRAYTEPAMFTRTDGLQVLLSRKVRGQLNGGGKYVHLESVSGNVSLRHGH
jgi:Putative adhesin